LPNPIIGLGAALGLPTRRKALSEETAGRTVTAWFLASQATAR
jgi:hypothetical protein